MDSWIIFNASILNASEPRVQTSSEIENWIANCFNLIEIMKKKSRWKKTDALTFLEKTNYFLQKIINYIINFSSAIENVANCRPKLNYTHDQNRIILFEIDITFDNYL